jgi:hypothetical protein
MCTRAKIISQLKCIYTVRNFSSFHSENYTLKDRYYMDALVCSLIKVNKDNKLLLDSAKNVQPLTSSFKSRHNSILDNDGYVL